MLTYRAGLSAIERVRTDHRRLPAVIVADALYATERFITALGRRRFPYVLGVKQPIHKMLFEDIGGLRQGGLLETHETVTSDGHRCLYDWVHDVRLFATNSAEVETSGDRESRLPQNLVAEDINDPAFVGVGRN